MAELKTKPTDYPAEEFIEKITPEWKKNDTKIIVQLMEDIIGEKPVMWGDSIIGFGKYHYKYETGREGDWFLTGCSPRKQNHTIYLTCGMPKNKTLLTKLGKHKTSVGCLYFKKLEDVDIEILKKIITDSVATTKNQLKT